MILDLEKIVKLERRYAHDPVAFEALRNMVLFVTTSNLNATELATTSQFQTLCDLGAVKGIQSKPEQLNS